MRSFLVYWPLATGLACSFTSMFAGGAETTTGWIFAVLGLVAWFQAYCVSLYLS